MMEMDDKSQGRLGVSILMGIALLAIVVGLAFPAVSDRRCLSPKSPGCLKYQQQVITQWVEYLAWFIAIVWLIALASLAERLFSSRHVELVLIGSAMAFIFVDIAVTLSHALKKFRRQASPRAPHG
jgi:bacteriorhodopsin